MQLPKGLGPFHIVGIGGIGMSAIAEVMHKRGFAVRGSDQKDSANVRRLTEKGIKCFVGHSPSNIEGARFVVCSSAVKKENPEVDAAVRAGVPVLNRAEMLAELMRPCSTVSVTGTHGKTTTTSLIAQIFEAAGLDPTVITGGIINAWGSNARMGGGPWMVVEADESDGTFIKLPTQIGVVTNIDPEHMDYWRSIADLHLAFKQFFDQIPFYGTAVAGLDHPIVREMIATIGREQKGRRVLTYGVADDADLRLSSFETQGAAIRFDASLGPKVRGGGRAVRELRLPMPGRHNALNALAAIAVATEAGIADDLIRKALADFAGVGRRFMPTGSWNGVDIVDDYAHHPVEIAATLKAARSAARERVIAIVQPHRYTRLKNLFGDFCTCFADADIVVVSPVYAAGEQPIQGVDRDSLIEGLRRQNKAKVVAMDGPETLAPIVARLAQPGDLVVGLGAGTITDWMQGLPSELAKLAPVGGVR